jgi:3-oxocholest-4-en-26-oyl-CoA dehydrogenase alpha subunit
MQKRRTDIWPARRLGLREFSIACPVMVHANTTTVTVLRTVGGVSSALSIRARVWFTPRSCQVRPRRIDRAVDLRLTDEQRVLREEATAFCASVRPLLEADPEWRRQGMLSDGDSPAVNHALGETGWIGMSWPRKLGGRGLSRLDATLVEEVFGYHWLPLSSYLLSYKTIGAAIERFAAPELVERLLPPIARGELVFCQGFSEPGAGTDLGSLTTRAVRVGDRFVVDGRKIWTSSAHLADWIYLAVRTDPELSKHRGLSVLVAPMDTPGIEVRSFPTLGGGTLCEVFLDGVEVPAANLVGELNGGWAVLMYTLDFERITAEKLGGVAWVLDRLEERIGPTIELARLRGELLSARLLSFRAADALDRGLPGSATSAMAKLSGARLMQRAADTVVDLLGLEGLAEGADAALEGRAAGLYRGSVGSTIAGGTTEVQQLVIARRGLGLA